MKCSESEMMARSHQWIICFYVITLEVWTFGTLILGTSFVDFLRCWREKTLHTELSGGCFCPSFETRVSDQDRLTYDAALHQKPGRLCLNWLDIVSRYRGLELTASPSVCKFWQDARHGEHLKSLKWGKRNGKSLLIQNRLFEIKVSVL